MCEQEGHLVREHAPALQIDVFRVCGCERYGEQRESGLLRRAAGLLVVAALAGGDHVVPGVLPASRQRADVVTGQRARREAPEPEAAQS